MTIKGTQGLSRPRPWPVPIEKLWKERGAVPRTWANAVEKLAAAEKIVQANAVEAVRRKQTALAKQVVQSRHV